MTVSGTFLGDRFFTPFEPELRTLEANWVPTVDFSETEKEYVIRLEAPGIHKENLDVNLEGNLLTLTGHREMSKDEEGEDYIWREREMGKFRRMIRLPVALDAAKVAATYQDGILVVRVPKAEKEVKSKIMIK